MKIEIESEALDSLKRMVEKLEKDAELKTQLLLKAKKMLDRYRLETPMGNQPHMITLEAYQTSLAIDAAMKG